MKKPENLVEENIKKQVLEPSRRFPKPARKL